MPPYDKMTSEEIETALGYIEKRLGEIQPPKWEINVFGVAIVFDKPILFKDHSKEIVFLNQYRADLRKALERHNSPLDTLAPEDLEEIDVVANG